VSGKRDLHQAVTVIDAATHFSDEAESDLIRLYGNDEKAIHVARFALLQYWLDRLGVKRPRARCGFRPECDPDRPDPDPAAMPHCVRCAEIAGW
jgi:hypothetical protein